MTTSVEVVDLLSIRPRAPSGTPRILASLGRDFVDDILWCVDHPREEAVYLGSIAFGDEDIAAGDHVGWLRDQAFEVTKAASATNAIGGLGEWVLLSRLRHLPDLRPVSLVSTSAVPEPDLIIEAGTVRPVETRLDIKTSAAKKGPSFGYEVVKHAAKGNPHLIVVGVADDMRHDKLAHVYFVHAAHLTNADWLAEFNRAHPCSQRETLDVGRQLEDRFRPARTKDQPKTFASIPDITKKALPLLNFPPNWFAAVDAGNGGPPTRKDALDRIEEANLQTLLKAARAARAAGAKRAFHVFSVRSRPEFREAGARIAWLWNRARAVELDRNTADLASAKWTVMRQIRASCESATLGGTDAVGKVKKGSVVSLGGPPQPDFSILEATGAAPAGFVVLNLSPSGVLAVDIDEHLAKGAPSILCTFLHAEKNVLDIYLVDGRWFASKGGAGIGGGRARLKDLLPPP